MGASSLAKVNIFCEEKAKNKQGPSHRFIMLSVAILIAYAFSSLCSTQARDPLILLLSIPFYCLLREAYSLNFLRHGAELAADGSAHTQVYICISKIKINLAIFAYIAGALLSLKYLYTMRQMYPHGTFSVDRTLSWLGYTGLLCATANVLLHGACACILGKTGSFSSLRKILTSVFPPIVFSVFSLIALQLHYHIRLPFLLLFSLFLSLLFFFSDSRLFKGKTKRTVSRIVGLIYTSFYFWAQPVAENFSVQALLPVLIHVVGLYFLFSRTIYFLYELLEYRSLMSSPLTEKQRSCGKCLLVFALSFSIIVFTFFLWFLYDYPGCISNDSNWQLKQLLGDAPYSNHHPYVHTIIIKLFYSLGFALHGGNQNAAVATYTLFQFVAMAAIFSYLIETLYAHNIKMSFLICVLLYFVFVPFHGFYSVTIWKDTLFGGIVLALCVVLWRLLDLSERKVRVRFHQYFALFVFSLLFCLFRSNGFYAFILFAPCFLLFTFRKDRLTSIIPLIALLLACVVRGPVYNRLGIIPSDTIESLSIPAQHISRAICDGAELTEEQLELLNAVVDVESIPEKYDPIISDPIKLLVREKDNQDFISCNKAKFLQLWIELGLKNPRSYLNAQIDQTLGYWYPPLVNWIISEDSFMSSSGLDTFPDRKLPAFLCPVFYYLRNYLSWDLSFLGLFFSIGTTFWAYIFLFGMCIINHRFSSLLLYVPVFTLIFSLFVATPVHAEFRYVYCLFTTLPLVLVLPFHKPQ